jgi:hypothetical protein
MFLKRTYMAKGGFLLGENTLVFNFLFIYHNIRLYQRNSYNKKQMFQVVERFTQPLNHRNLRHLL